MVAKLEDGLRVRSSLTIEPNTAITGLTRASLDAETSAKYAIPFERWRVWNSGAVLPNVSALDDLGLYTGTFATDTSSLKTYDVKTVGATNLYARQTITMPAEYVATQAARIRLACGMVGAVADASCSVDVEAYLSNGEGVKTGSDLQSVAATSCNSLVFADIDYTLDGSVLSPGSEIDVRINVAVNDGAGGASVQAVIGAAYLLCTIRG